jgi:26S proteasome regulatory subunit N8
LLPFTQRIHKSKDGTATTHTFTHVASEIQAEEAEEIGVEHLLRDIKDNAVGSLSTRITSNYTALQSLESQLDTIIGYVDRVVSGELPVNHAITYHLQNVFNLIPQIQGDQAALTNFRTKVNDETLVIYLASLIRATTALHDLVDNKVDAAPLLK